ncbi:uncharacterized protein PAC_06044 [Phialocephala subalpina]|uniref:Uncharacterized protein n=1 Tax=Phialocephala subalpina TaxID=576137 RepID=A0A1L7WTR7_9HELO|nr:uncharacterized protein PAC_06044 [Phialocephala subalpina]
MPYNGNAFEWRIGSRGNATYDATYVQSASSLAQIGVAMLSEQGVIAQRYKHLEILCSFIEAEYILQGPSSFRSTARISCLSQFNCIEHPLINTSMYLPRTTGWAYAITPSRPEKNGFNSISQLLLPNTSDFSRVQRNMAPLTAKEPRRACVEKLFNISRLGSQVFDISDRNGLSLRNIFGSIEYCQGWFDGRNDACALFQHYGVRLGWIRDIQLLNIAGRLGELKNRRQSLYDCMQDIGGEFLSKEELSRWLKAKRDGREFFAKNGWDVLLQWLLTETVREYVAGNTPYLPKMEEAYVKRIRKVEALLESRYGKPFFLMELVDKESMKRVTDSTSPTR